MSKIDRPGIYDISMASYHGDCCVGPSISSSGLRKIFLKSPKHYWKSSYLNPNRKPDKETEAFILGRAAHHLLLGEEDFSTLFIMRPDEAPDGTGRAWNGNNISCKAWLKAQEKAGRTVLTPTQVEAIRGMARALADDPMVQAGILNGDIEKSIIWKDKTTGIWLKARPDAIPNDSGDFCDLKTTAAIGYDLDRDVSKYRYDMQGALTGMGVREVLGRDMESFSFCFVENDDPHSVDTLTLINEDIGLAEKDIRVALDTFAWCLETGIWFGAGGTQRDARPVHITEWAKKDAEFRRDFLKREIERPLMDGPSEADYLATG